MVAETVSEAELASSLTEVLDHVRDGARVAVERDGTVVATIVPPEPKGLTWGEFVAMYPTLPRPDDQFADDLEAIATATFAAVRPGITARELIDRVGDLPMPGDGFADDLESIQAAQGVAEYPEWPD